MLETIKEWFVDIGRGFSNFFKPFRGVVDWFNDLLEPFRDFIAENSRNPFLWIGFIILGLIIFELTFRALHKD